MYTSFFGLKEDPFNLSPDPRYLFLSPYHKEALDHMLYGINERKGFIAITGGIGTGKTTVCRTLLNQLHDSTKSALIFSAFLSDIELLKAINREFGIETEKEAETRQDYIDSLNNFLIDTYKNGGNSVLLIDEAQNLSQPALEQVRMLSNLETEKEKLIQIVLVGQTELADMLSSPSMRQLNERITVRYNLRPLNLENMRGYVEHRLVVAGGHGNIKFTGGALRRIYSFSLGNPRRINAVCDRALLIAFAKGKYMISAGMIGQAIRDLRGGINPGHEPGGLLSRKVVYVTITLTILLTFTAFAGWNFKHYLSKNTAAVSQAEKVKPEDRIEDLFLDDQTSLASLFSLFATSKHNTLPDQEDINLAVVSFALEPEYYVMLKKPFRVNSAGHPEGSNPLQRYMLIRETSPEGAVVVEKKGNQRTVSRAFILKNWGGKVSFVYPLRRNATELKKGMVGQDILNVQHMLARIGYIIDFTGTYDEPTFSVVLKFQSDFGLENDGIVGPRTAALLYQMVE
ncbi:MAG: AAA family ATPase [Deltaproteobacteria bacterium]|nr:AAA family ATPase [Deltaproteobacteria bacterium]